MNGTGPGGELRLAEPGRVTISDFFSALRSDAVTRLPTTLEKRGDFSQSFDSAGRLVVIYDPLSTACDAALVSPTL